VALAIDMDGKKEILGLWIAPTEGAKFWLGVMTELRNRGVRDLFIASIDGLKGLPEAIETVFPEVEVQAVHRPYDQELNKICQLEGPQGSMQRSQGGVLSCY
jgi:transposase-like protein